LTIYSLKEITEFDPKLCNIIPNYTPRIAENERLTKQTGNDFRKAMYSIHTGPDAMSAPVITSLSVKVHIYIYIYIYKTDSKINQVFKSAKFYGG